MAKKQKPSQEVAELLAAIALRPSKYDVSSDLAELLAAYGDPPTMPTYRGDALEYMRAVNVFEKLCATSEAVARREAMDRYFKKKETRAASAPSDTDGVA